MKKTWAILVVAASLAAVFILVDGAGQKARAAGSEGTVPGGVPPEEATPAAAPVVGPTAPAAAQEESVLLATPKARVSYCIGLDFGNTLKRQSIDVEPDIVAKGMKDALTGTKPLLTQQEFREVMTVFQREYAAQHEQARRQLAEKNLKDGEAFLAANKTKEGVITLPDGLQYIVLKEGTGASPKATDTVSTQYRGTLVDGTEFDSTYIDNQPATFPLTGVIAGWTEALQMMKTGAKWKLFIPANLAYGADGRGGVIGPNAVLVFEIELVSIQPAR